MLMVPIILVWESEEWLKEHVKPLAQSGGLSIFIFSIFMVSILTLVLIAFRRSRTVNSD